MKRNKMIKKAKKTFSQAADYVKEKVSELSAPPSTSISKLADYISSHPDTKMTVKTWLNRDFTFYKLEENGVSYYLEKKGSHILQLDAAAGNEEIVTYRSYKDYQELNAPIPSVSQMVRSKNNKKAGISV